MNIKINLKTCFFIVAGLLIAIFVFKIPLSGLLTLGLVLLCPLMHLFMMKGMNHDHENCHNDNKGKAEEGELVKEKRIN